MLSHFFRQARLDLDKALAKVTHMEANYNEVVPRRDFIELENKFKFLSEHVKQLQTVNENQTKELEQVNGQNE